MCLQQITIRCSLVYILSGTNVDAQSVVIPQTGTWAIIDDLVLGANPTYAQTKMIFPKITQVSPNPTSRQKFNLFQHRNFFQPVHCALLMLQEKF